MKVIRMIISGVLASLIAIGLISTFSGSLKDASQYRDDIKLAEECVEKSLYQKAIINYENALKYKESKKVRDSLLNAYQLGYEDSVITKSEFEKVYLASCELYPDAVDYWETILKHFIDVKSYSKAYDVYKDITRNNVESESLSELTNQVLYSYNNKTSLFNEVIGNIDRNYSLCKDGYWGTMSSGGEITAECYFKYISPINSNGEAVYVSDKGTRVLDSEGIVQYILDEPIEKCRAIGDEIIPVCFEEKEMRPEEKEDSEKNDEIDGEVEESEEELVEVIVSRKWRYYSIASNKYILEDYDDASSFINGKAFVNKAGKWYYIDVEGNAVTDVVFDDVKLYQNGEYINSGIIVASVDGKYSLYDAKCERISDFVAADIDVFYGGDIAFKSDEGLWGYVDNKGKVVIEPQFKEAKSFSNKLAAVSNGESWGFINAKGELVIDYTFVYADYFTENGICAVKSMNDYYNFIILRFN